MKNGPGLGVVMAILLGGQTREQKKIASDVSGEFSVQQLQQKHLRDP